MWEHVLYRLYGHDGELLYVGITNSIAVRFKTHAGDKPWWPEVAGCRVDFLPDREALKRAERDAIWYERPRHNVMGSVTPPTPTSLRPRRQPPPTRPQQYLDVAEKLLNPPARKDGCRLPRQGFESRPPAATRQVVRALHLGGPSLDPLLNSAERVELIVGERGLHGPTRDLLIKSTRHPAVSSVSVLPLDSTLWLAARTGFVMYGSPRVRRVVVPMVHGVADVERSPERAAYAALWERLWKGAAHGDAARALIRKVS